MLKSLTVESWELSQTQMLADLAKELIHFQFNLKDETLAAFKQNLDNYDNKAKWITLETIRTLGFDRKAPDFYKYVEKTFDDSEDIDGTSVTKLGTDYLDTPAAKTLTEEQKFKLLFYAALVEIVIALFMAFQSGKPIKIDPAQLESLKSHPEVTVNLLKFFSQVKPTVYQAERRFNLKLKPTNRSMTMIRIEQGEEVQLIRNAHKWVYVEYQDKEEGLPIYGWANKKYLKKEKP